MSDSGQPTKADQDVDELPRLHRKREASLNDLRKGDSVVDDDGTVHLVAWTSRARDFTDFSIACRATILSAGTPFFVPTNEKATCLRCLAEN